MDKNKLSREFPLRKQGRPCGHGPGSQGLNTLDIGGEYTEEEITFIRAMEAYMKVNKRRFPSFTEVLRVAKSLGYRKVEGVSKEHGQG